MTQHDYDVVIVGGGPAGLTAAIYTGRANPKQVGFVENFHRYAPSKSATLESILDRDVEHPLAKHYHVMLAALQISGEERDWLDRMLMNQLTRLPHQRERIKQMVEAIVSTPQFAHRRGLDMMELHEFGQAPHEVDELLSTRVLVPARDRIAAMSRQAGTSK